MQRTPYDYKPLQRPVTLIDLVGRRRLSPGLKIGITIACIALTLPIIAAVNSIDSMRDAATLIVILIFVFIAAILSVIAIHAARHIKLERFAEANNFTITKGVDLSHRSGVLLSTGRASNHSISLTSPSRPSIEVGNVIGDRATYGRYAQDFGFIRLTLPREFPHIILDAVANHLNTRDSAVPLSSRAPEVTRLEGDFSNTFHIYAPGGYGSDVRYILPPDFMAFLVDYASEFDIEFIGNDLYLYRLNYFKLTDPAELDTLLASAQDLYDIIANYLGPYSDWRVGEHGATTVAPQAREIAKGNISFAGLLALVAFLLGFFWPHIIHALHRFTM